MIGSAQDTLEENYLLQKFSRKVMHSNNVDLYSSYPDKNLVKEIHPFLFSASSRGRMDLTRTDTILVLGTDASISHPLLENKIRKAFNTGRNVLYANPYPTRTSQFANQEINHAPGEEYNFLFALLAGLARENKAILPSGLADHFKKPEVVTALKSCAVADKDLQAFVKVLAKSRNLSIIAGDDYLRNSTGRDILKALRNIPYLKGEKSRCNTTILGYEGNIYAGALAGVHPDILPGFDPVSEGKAIQKWNKNWHAKLNTTAGFSCDEMLTNIGRDGISALMIAGDIPPNPKLHKLKFLVQLNMFRTGVSEYADVFLPVTGFLENEGHFMTLDGKIKKLRRVIASSGKSKPITAIIPAIADAMNESGFASSRPGVLWKEIQPIIKFPTSGAFRETQKIQLIKPRTRTNGSDDTSYSKIRYDHFRYRGNNLTNLVPDLQTAVEGMGIEKA